ncbi:hypothetical protein [Desulfitobacterium sp. AusDCA]|uniref:hypothetical protein n=1 Tax=Desulfitobacterium sp. AusDCA TaxID=3240383 RepID=UPI003DA77908
MIFPLGEYLVFSMGLLAVFNKLSNRSKHVWMSVSGAWLIGRLLEIAFPWSSTRIYHYHFAQILALAALAATAWQYTSGRKILPAVMTSFVLVGQNLLVLNEPAMFLGEQWFFGGIVLLISFLSTADFWGIALALAGGILLDLGMSVLLFQGVVRYYELPDPFYWQLSIAFLTSLSIRKSLSLLWHRRSAEKLKESEDYSLKNGKE